MRRYSASLIIKQMQGRTIVRAPHTHEDGYYEKAEMPSVGEDAEELAPRAQVPRT